MQILLNLKIIKKTYQKPPLVAGLVCLFYVMIVNKQ